MKVILDDDGDELVLEAQNYVCVELPLGGGRSRVVKVTYQGVFEEITDADGDVECDACIEHEDLLPSDG